MTAKDINAMTLEEAEKAWNKDQLFVKKTQSTMEYSVRIGSARYNNAIERMEKLAFRIAKLKKQDEQNNSKT